MTTYTIKVEEIPGSDEVMIQLPDDVILSLGLRVGDKLNWDITIDGTILLTKKEPETELVLVECVSMFRTRYLVEVPKGQRDWALDSVVMEEVPEFSQKHLDETIVSHRVVDEQEAREIYEEDNPECKGHNFDLVVHKV